MSLESFLQLSPEVIIDIGLQIENYQKNIANEASLTVPRIHLQEKLISHYNPYDIAIQSTSSFPEWESLLDDLYLNTVVLDENKRFFTNIHDTPEASEINRIIREMYQLIGDVNGYKLSRKNPDMTFLFMSYAKSRKKREFQDYVEKFFAREILEQMNKTPDILEDNMEALRRTRRMKTALKQIVEEKKAEEQKATTEIKISFTEVVVLHYAFRCDKDHDVVPMTAVVKLLTSLGVEIEKRITVGYCSQCCKLILLKADFDDLRREGVLLCQLISSDYNKQPNYSGLGFGDMKAESVLHQSGYNVNQNANLTTIQRQRILQMVIDHDLYTKIGIMSFLDWLISRAKKSVRGNMNTAIEKWQADRDFVSQYRKTEQPLVQVSRINYKK